MHWSARDRNSYLQLIKAAQSASSFKAPAKFPEEKSQLLQNCRLMHIFQYIFWKRNQSTMVLKNIDSHTNTSTQFPREKKKRKSVLETLNYLDKEGENGRKKAGYPSSYHYCSLRWQFHLLIQLSILLIIKMHRLI